MRFIKHIRAGAAIALALITTAVSAQQRGGDWEVFTCVEEEEAGYRVQLDQQGMGRNRYPGATFTFSLSASEPVGVLVEEGTGVELYLDCVIPYEDKAPTTISCTEGAHTFVMDLESGRFAFARMFGYVFPDPAGGGPNGDALTIGYGVCRPAGQGI